VASSGGVWDVLDYMGTETTFGLHGADINGVTWVYDDSQVKSTGVAVASLIGLSISFLSIQFLLVLYSLIKGVYSPPWWPWLELMAKFVDLTTMFAWLTWVFWGHRRLMDLLPESPDVGWCWGVCLTAGFFCFVCECLFRIFGLNSYGVDVAVIATPAVAPASTVDVAVVPVADSKKQTNKQKQKKNKKQQESNMQEGLLSGQGATEYSSVGGEDEESPEGVPEGSKG